MRLRRPSAATTIALVALFVALGGPARAASVVSGSQIKASSITSKQVKARSLSITDLTLASSRLLQSTPADSVSSAQLKDGAVGALELAPGSVFADKLAPGAVGGSSIVTDGIGSRALAESSVGASELLDGSVGAAEIPSGALGASDVGRFGGTIPALDFGSLARGACATRTSGALTPYSGAQDLTGEAIVLTPNADFPADGLTVTAQAASADQVKVTACNVGGADPVAVGAQTFKYVTFDTGS